MPFLKKGPKTRFGKSAHCKLAEAVRLSCLSTPSMHEANGNDAYAYEEMPKKSA